MTLDRRTFLMGTGAAAAGVALGGPFQGLLARAAGAKGSLASPGREPRQDVAGGAPATLARAQRPR